MRFTKEQIEILQDFHNGLSANGAKMQWRSGEWALYFGKPYIYLGQNKWLEVLTGLEFSGKPSSNFLYLPMLYEDWIGLARIVWGNDYMKAMADLAEKSDRETTPENRLIKRIMLFMNKSGMDKGTKTDSNDVKDASKSKLIIEP